MLPNWERRPTTVAHLLNPAFCGELIRRCANFYTKSKKSKGALPFQLSFVLMPLVLHKAIRETLPKSTRKNFIAWVEENQSIKMEIPDLIKRTVPFTKEAIMFLLMYEVIEINSEGKLNVLQKVSKQKFEGEVGECYKKAEFLGKWLASSGNAQSIFITLGIKP